MQSERGRLVRKRSRSDLIFQNLNAPGAKSMNAGAFICGRAISAPSKNLLFRIESKLEHQSLARIIDSISMPVLA